MNVGSLYKVKKYFWLIFPTKEIATDATRRLARNPFLIFDFLPVAATAVVAASYVNYCSRQCNREVTYFSPDSIVVFLENDGELKKVLTSEGRIGWTGFDESYNKCFEELKAEP